MKNNIEIKTGLFLFIGLTVLLVSIFLLGSNKSLFQDNFNVYSIFDSVQGLNNGAVVTIAGVKAGNIKDILFDSQSGKVKVEYVLEKSLAEKLKNSSTVEIRTQGALGDKFLYINPNLEGENIKNNTEITVAEGKDLLSIVSKRGSESEKLFDTIDDLHKIINSISQQNKIPSVINKLDASAGQLQLATAKLNSILNKSELENSFTKLNHIMTKIDSGQGSLGALINDRSIHDRLKNILGAGQKQQNIKSILKNSLQEE